MHLGLSISYEIVRITAVCNSKLMVNLGEISVILALSLTPMTATKLNFTQFLSSNTGPQSPHRCSLDQKLPVQKFLKSEFFANPSLDYSFNIQKKPGRL